MIPGVLASAQLMGGAPPLTGASAARGTFLTGTATAGNNVTVTGLVDGDAAAFTPAFVLFWWNGLDGSGSILQRNNIRSGFGVAVSSSDRRNAGGQSADASGTMSTDGEEGDESCIRVLGTTGALAGALDVVSMDSGGFTLVVDTQFAADMRVHFLALGGVDITNVQTGMIDEPAATGDQGTTGVGFLPDLLIFFGAQSLGTPPTQFVHHSNSLGFAVRGGNQKAVMWRDQDGVANSSGRSWPDLDAVLGRVTFNAQSLQALAAVTSFDADGFTLNWSARSATGVNFHYLAVKGGTWAANTLVTPTDTVTTVSVSGLASEPVAALFLSAGGADETWQVGASRYIGAAVSPTDRGTNGIMSQSGAADSVCICGQREDAVYQSIVHDNPTPTLRALMDVQSFDSGGLTCIMDDAETSGVAVYVLTFGPS